MTGDMDSRRNRVTWNAEKDFLEKYRVLMESDGKTESG